MYKQLYWSHSAQIGLKIANQNKVTIKKDTDSSENGDSDASTRSLHDGNEEPTRSEQIEVSTLGVRQTVSAIKKCENYFAENCLTHLKRLDDIFESYEAQHDEGTDDLLADLKFYEIAVNIFKQINNMDTIETELMWTVFSTTLSICWNVTDTSEKFCNCFQNAGAVEILTEALKHTPYLDGITSLFPKLTFKALSGILNTLHNIVRFTGVKYHFKQAKTAEKLMILMNSNDLDIHTIAMLVLAYIVEEDENDKIIDKHNIINIIVTLLREAIKNANRRAVGFTAWELTKGLSKLAVNDANKMKIIEEGALEEFIKMFSNNDAIEVENVAECLWTLAFDVEVRSLVKKQSSIIAALENLQNSTIPKIKNNAQGALWMINGAEKRDSVPNQRSSDQTGSHIFISYCSAEKEIVKRIYNSLRSKGFTIWIDWDKMEGSTLQAMAEAVENAYLVLICTSEKYKQSPFCRTEAEYTYHKKKNYLPLKVQESYSPDGWLGAMIGTKYFYDFSGKYIYEDIMQKLIKALGGEINAQYQQVSSEITPHTQATISCISMSAEEVLKWLESKGLQRLSSAFSKIDGQMLWDMKSLCDVAPDYFYKTFGKEFGVKLADIIQLHAALKSLK